MAKKQPEYTFEIYCLNDTLTADNWKSLYKAFITHLGILGGKFRVIFAAKDNIIRFFIQRKRLSITGLPHIQKHRFLRRPNRLRISHCQPALAHTS